MKNGVSQAFSIIDPHVHFWRLNTGFNTWLQEGANLFLGDYRAMVKDHGPSEFEHNARPYVITQCVHIEAEATVYAKAEADWLEDLAQKTPLIGAIVGGVDFLAHDCEALLEHYAILP
ncbi:MAG: hypothetical protein COV52_04600 [Gammaproteobacteria bacterium CG11_big_fil_rev_8_21_14_0_20_46_22]|nr:MAG: hypothetical protein COW05_02790 [Gammaproteobacteria bacterium CG12_big_fil_rev_8_21_14_0_65_46_12]PIR11335.1 MAG: hypothetical protein COV52_04600 [Gammaproteobacteria bacterium CG11_big_fil_rev_8_21_14_0_20_46_22]